MHDRGENHVSRLKNIIYRSAPTYFDISGKTKKGSTLFWSYFENKFSKNSFYFWFFEFIEVKIEWIKLWNELNHQNCQYIVECEKSLNASNNPLQLIIKYFKPCKELKILTSLKSLNEIFENFEIVKSSKL